MERSANHLQTPPNASGDTPDFADTIIAKGGWHLSWSAPIVVAGGWVGGTYRVSRLQEVGGWHLSRSAGTLVLYSCNHCLAMLGRLRECVSAWLAPSTGRTYCAVESIDVLWSLALYCDAATRVSPCLARPTIAPESQTLHLEARTITQRTAP